MIKSIIRYLNIRWLPEAGGCILVGVLGYVILSHMPHVQFAFDGDMFLRIMVPPIVFEAAVKINKQSFRRHALPITIYAIVGTLASTAFTAAILHKGSSMLNCTTIPIKESLIFGALISSIDPIAVLSVLNNMGMTDSDAIYVLIFGESLLNDGVAIVLFQTLVHFLDETLVVDAEVIFDAIMHFVVVACGSLSVGMLSGASATIYFATMNGCQTPLVECIMFFCWAIIPYYICDMVEWSGIVAIVANGFVMDLFVVGQKRNNVDDEIEFLVNGTSNGSSRTRNNNRRQCRSFFNYEGHLSEMANNHVHFVIEIFATLMETAIFAYLGLFLFSSRYHWSAYLTIISIFATVMGRVIMIPTLSHISNVFNRVRGQRNRTNSPRGEISDGVHVDRRMQLVLIFAGLRGAMSFALVEHIPMFDTTTGQGSRFKPELKSMTSASVIFTVFVLGGATPYLLERLGYSLTKEQDSVEITPLVQRHKKETPSHVRQGAFPTVRGIGSIRQRAQPSR
jgi:NhaP-type Na+/H+ or K+/H+ antiporter